MDGVTAQCRGRFTARGLITAIAYFYALAFPFLLFIVMETLNTTGYKAAAPAILESAPIVALSGFALLTLMAAAFIIVGNLFVSGVILSAAVGFFYVFNYYRLLLSGWVLVPADLAMVSHAGDLAGFTNIRLYPVILVFTVLIAALWAALFFASKRVKINIRARYALLPIVMCAGLYTFATGTAKRAILPRFGVNVSCETPINSIYQTNGVLLGLYATLFFGGGAEEGAFTADQLNTLFSQIERNAKAAPYSSGYGGIDNEDKPNVIVILSEAFFDPTTMQNWAPDHDPAPNLRRLSAAYGGEYTGGSFITPTFAGGTCNPEWEFLTGNAVIFAEGGNIMAFEYEDVYVGEYDNRSLANQFLQNGYKTVSVHTYKKDFFNRETVHPKLGFQKSIFAEDMEGAPIKGSFISDEYFTDRIIEEIDTAAESGDPLFLFGISMQNHYYFDSEKYNGLNEFEVSSDVLTAEMAGSLRTYCQGVSDADKQLGRLIEYCGQTGRKTIVVFFGDHLPSLEPSAYAIYDTLGFALGGDMANWDTEAMLNMFTTPYIVWSSYGDKDDSWGAASPYFLGALVANKAGITMNYYYEYLLQTYLSPDGFKAYKKGVFIDSGGKAADAPGGDDVLTVNRFRAIQYDNIYGGGVIKDKLAELNKR